MLLPTHASRDATLATLCVAAWTVAGCAPAPGSRDGVHGDVLQQQASAEAAPADQQSAGWTTTPLGVRSEPVAVKAGTTPLVYLVESGGTFRVRDETAGQDIASAFAPARSIVRVDGRNGVVFGRETLLAGPLAEEHRYVIYQEPAGPNMMRQGVFQVRPDQSQAGARPQTQTQTQTQNPSEGSGPEVRQEGGPDAQR